MQVLNKFYYYVYIYVLKLVNSHIAMCGFIALTLRRCAHGCERLYIEIRHFLKLIFLSALIII